MDADWQPPNAEHPPPKAGEPPLYRAARVGNHDALRRLATEGANLDAVFDIGLDPGARAHPATPLMVAAGSGDGARVGTVRLLLELGADPTIVNDSGSAATFACLGLGWNYRPGGDAARLQALLEAGAPLPTGGWAGPRTVASVASAGDAKRLRVLLDHGLTPDPIWDPKEAAKEHARMRKELGSELPKFVTKMLDSNEDWSQLLGPPNAAYDFEIPVHCAAMAGSVACLELLEAAGADLSIRSSSSPNALFVAGSAEVVRWLLFRGIDPNARASGGTDAFGALLNRLGEGGVSSEVPKALLECLPDLVQIPEWPHTRLASAAFSRNAGAVALLLELGVPAMPPNGCPSALHQVCWQGSSSDEEIEDGGVAIIHTLVAAGADIEARDDEGRTPLHKAAGGDWGYPAAIRALLRNGAQPDPVDDAGATPLMLAASNGEVECVRELLFAGADTLRQDREGKSALMRAKAYLRTWKGVGSFGMRLVGGKGWPDIEANARRQAEEVVNLLEAARR